MRHRASSYLNIHFSFSETGEVQWFENQTQSSMNHSQNQGGNTHTCNHSEGDIDTNCGSFFSFSAGDRSAGMSFLEDNLHDGAYHHQMEDL